MTDSPTTPRAADADRSRRLLDCAVMVMLQVGSHQFSMRKVARAAGVSLGHLQHYFPTRGDLLRAMLASLEADFFESYKRDLKPIRDPVERYAACARFVIERKSGDHVVPLMREFWVLASRDEGVGRLLHEFYLGCRNLAAGMLCEANPALPRREAVLRAAASVSALSGAFLYLEDWGTGKALPHFDEHLLDSIGRMAFADSGSAKPAPA